MIRVNSSEVTPNKIESVYYKNSTLNKIFTQSSDNNEFKYPASRGFVSFTDTPIETDMVNLAVSPATLTKLDSSNPSVAEYDPIDGTVYLLMDSGSTKTITAVNGEGVALGAINLPTAALNLGVYSGLRVDSVSPNNGGWIYLSCFNGVYQQCYRISKKKFLEGKWSRVYNSNDAVGGLTNEGYITCDYAGRCFYTPDYGKTYYIFTYNSDSSQVYDLLSHYSGYHYEIVSNKDGSYYMFNRVVEGSATQILTYVPSYENLIQIFNGTSSGSYLSMNLSSVQAEAHIVGIDNKIVFVTKESSGSRYKFYYEIYGLNSSNQLVSLKTKALIRWGDTEDLLGGFGTDGSNIMYLHTYSTTTYLVKQTYAIDITQNYSGNYPSPLSNITRTGYVLSLGTKLGQVSDYVNKPY